MKFLSPILLFILCLLLILSFPVSAQISGGPSGGGGSGTDANAVHKANNGTDFSNRRTTGSNLAIKQASPLGGNNAYTDLAAATPAYEGQLAVGYGNDFRGVIGLAGSTTAGDWNHALIFGYGLGGIGLSGVDAVTHAPNGFYPDPSATNIIQWIVNGGPPGWKSAQDGGVFLANYSTNNSNPGAGWGGGVMYQDPTTGLQVLRDAVGGATLVPHVPTNVTVRGLIPGYGGIVWNTYSDLQKGFWIGSPGLNGFNSDNSPLVFLDAINKLSGVPLWVNGACSPSDAGYQWAWKVSPVTGAATALMNINASNFVSSGVLDLSDVRITHFGANGGDLAIADSGGTLFAEVSKNTGMNLRGAAGQLYSWNNSSQFSNVANGTVALQTSSGGQGTLLANIYASNVLSGGQLPLGTVSSSTGSAGQFLGFNGTARTWTNITGADIASGTLSSNVLPALGYITNNTGVGTNETFWAGTIFQQPTNQPGIEITNAWNNSTTPVPFADITGTWNNGSLNAPTAFRLNVTNIASAGVPILMDLRNSGTSEFNVTSGGTVTANGNMYVNGSIVSTYVGGGLAIKSGANSKIGQAKLASGTVTVANTAVTANSQIFLWGITASGTIGTYFAPTNSIVAGTSFVINSVTGASVVQTLDTSTVGYMIVEKN